MLFEWELQFTLFDWREFLQHNRVRTAGKIFHYVCGEGYGQVDGACFTCRYSVPIQHKVMPYPRMRD